ncbi:hypothetical protein [Nocardioides zeae]|uniref:DUF2236 domain-containing protein n=1 Tax=Nocardioides zeae TaxID=1457234 RepID=A0AAJ1X3F3_9ACTN|nr:hypothetical protein [Nocardioides zeae]MDQ1105639.1 hypothetical protein [Nocardioides zeae]
MARRTKPRKWIAAEMATLDPHTDYARIWALSSVYYVNDFMLDWIYAITFPRFIAPLRGAQAVLRGGTGKIYTDPDKRMDDTSRHMLVWWEKGPDHPDTQRSVRSLNNLHRYWAQQYPGRFTFNEDYVYTLCYEAAMMHRLRISLGLPGFDDKMQVAAWEFWSRMAEQFVNVGSPDDRPLEGFPSDFAEINAYMDRYEGENWPRNPLGHEVTDVILRPFAERHFPRVLHPLAKQMVTSLYPDFIFAAHGMARPHPLVRRLVRGAFRAALVVNEKVVADPEVSLPEIHRRRRAATGRARVPTRNERARTRTARQTAVTCPAHAVATGPHDTAAPVRLADRSA